MIDLQLKEGELCLSPYVSANYVNFKTQNQENQSLELGTTRLQGQT